MSPFEVEPVEVEPVEDEPLPVEPVAERLELRPPELRPPELQPPDAEPVKWLDESEARAWRSFQRMQMRLLARLAHDLGVHSGLSYQDYAVLVALTDEPEGGMRLFQLGHELGWEKSRISHQVTRMAQRGLVEKHACGSDRRGAVVFVTEAGRNEIGAAAPSHLRAVRRLFIDRLTPAQLENLAAVADTVLAAVAEEELAECAEPCEVDT
jgi:DNA-binding MarR family transcriptional regulator